MNWLNRLLSANRSWLMAGLLLLMALTIGIQIGQSRVHKQWSTEKSKNEQIAAKLEQHVEDVKRMQNQINRDISNDYLKKSMYLAGSQSDTRLVGVCNVATAGGGSVPILSAGVDATSTNLIPVAAADEVMTSCSQLVKDSAKTTLMLLEFQNWYVKQASSAITNP
jgi:hypothetical protein